MKFLPQHCGAMLFRAELYKALKPGALSFGFKALMERARGGWAGGWVRNGWIGGQRDRAKGGVKVLSSRGWVRGKTRGDYRVKLMK
jgi:hypothetical protein